jgi:hypothetical protein
MRSADASGRRYTFEAREHAQGPSDVVELIPAGVVRALTPVRGAPEPYVLLVVRVAVMATVVVGRGAPPWP